MEQPATLIGTAPLLYATLGPRVKAVIRDMFVYAGGMVVLVLLSSFMQPGPVLRAIVIVLVAALILYEPVLVSWAGGTLGHRSLNLRVVRATDSGRVAFPRALLRFLVKSVTGLLGFLAIELTRRHQGLHDLAAGTVVVPRGAPSTIEGFAPARVADLVVLPSKLRRTVIVAGYLTFLFVLMAAVSAVVYTPGCLYENQCTEVDRFVELILGLAFLVILAVLIVAGGRGYLPGARRQCRADPPRADPDEAV